MNKEQALIQLKDLLFNFENFEEVETTDEDVQALKYTIDELEKTAPEVSVQEQLLNEISNGSKTINQVRKEYGLEPIEDGDTFTIKL